ncbi:chemotaxis protein, partial [Pseudomonas syringae pv. tagetis]
RTCGSTSEIAEMIGKILAETGEAVASMDATQDGAIRGVTLADQAGQVFVQIRDGASDAVEAVNMFATSMDEAEAFAKP